MKFRTGMIVGGALGYYYGAKAGRERFEQIDNQLAKIRSRPGYKKAKGQVSGSVGGVKDAAKQRAGQVVGSVADTASEKVDQAVEAIRPEPESSFEPGLEFNPDFTPTADEIEADLKGNAPSA